MTLHPSAPSTQPGETRHRRTLLALGVAGLATVLAGIPGASGKKNAAKRARKKAKRKARKQCEREITTCTDQVSAFCNGVSEPDVCRTTLLPCCATCDVAVGMTCVITRLVPAA